MYKIHRITTHTKEETLSQTRQYIMGNISLRMRTLGPYRIISSLKLMKKVLTKKRKSSGTRFLMTTTYHKNLMKSTDQLTHQEIKKRVKTTELT